MRLGIDFGTTRTVVSAVLKGGYSTVSFHTGDVYRDYLPSMAAVRDGQLLYGWDAAKAMREGAQGAVRSIKRLVSGLAPDAPVPGMHGITVSALQLTSGYLQYVHRMLVDHAKVDVIEKGKRKRFRISGELHASVAVPANASTPQRYTTLEAFSRAGFAVDGMVNEPTAAAIEFAYRKLGGMAERSPKRYIVVYDLGGGTFDTSAVSLYGRHYDLLHTEGIARLGGDDIDEMILEMAAHQAGVCLDGLDSRSRTAALETCRIAKEALTASSRKLTVDLRRDLAGQGGAEIPVITIDTHELYERCLPLIERTLIVVRELFAKLDAHGIDPHNPRELGGLYLVGGAVAFPPVARALRAEYKRKILLAPQPHAATAIGLAIAGDPKADLRVREAITRHFGVWREAENGHLKVFDHILSKNTVPKSDQPHVVHRVYQPTHTIGALRFIECASLTSDGQPAGDLTPWSRVLFPYAPDLAQCSDLTDIPIERSPAVLGENITETYSYDKSGTIAVVIANLTRGYERRFVLGELR